MSFHQVVLKLIRKITTPFAAYVTRTHHFWWSIHFDTIQHGGGCGIFVGCGGLN